MRILRIIVPIIVIIGLLAMAPGCYGSFSLVTKVYKWNGTLGNKWVNEVAFIALNIVPVYSVASFIDAVILNSIEFWTGKNPMNASIDLPEQGASLAANEDGSVRLTSKDGLTLTIIPTTDGAEVRDADGQLLARSVRTADGVTIYSPEGTELGSMNNDQIASLVK